MPLMMVLSAALTMSRCAEVAPLYLDQQARLEDTSTLLEDGLMVLSLIDS